MISKLLNTIRKSLRCLAEFLAVLSLGFIAGVIILLPWLLRALALISWLAGTFLVWLTINSLYGPFTPPLPLFALTTVPAILSVALVVWLFYRGQQGHLWGAMTLWGVIGFLVWKGSMVLTKWHYGSLVIQVLPAALCAVLLLYINIHWGSIIRTRRLVLKDDMSSNDGLSSSESIPPNQGG